MKTSLMLFVAFALVLLTMSVLFANPDLLPKHPGYPMGKAAESAGTEHQD